MRSDGQTTADAINRRYFLESAGLGLGDRRGQRLHPLAERLALVGEGELRPMLVAGRSASVFSMRAVAPQM